MQKAKEEALAGLNAIQRKVVEAMFEPVETEMQTISKESIVEGNRDATLWVMGLFLLNFGVSFWLPGKKEAHKVG
jgi:hypothetical protein